MSKNYILINCWEKSSSHLWKTPYLVSGFQTLRRGFLCEWFIKWVLSGETSRGERKQCRREEASRSVVSGKAPKGSPLPDPEGDVWSTSLRAFPASRPGSRRDAFWISAHVHAVKIAPVAWGQFFTESYGCRWLEARGQGLGKERAEVVRGTQEDLAEHHQYPPHTLRGRTRSLL